MRALSATLLLLAVAGGASAQSPAAPLEGRVLDEAGRPVAGARVAAGGAAARTDEEGRFRLEGLPADAVLEIEADGFLPARVPVRALGEAPAEVRLQARKRFEETVDVVAPREPAAGPAEIGVRPLEVMTTAGSMDNVFRTLHTLPGVAATEEFGSRLAVRGGGPDENLTVMDGVEIHNPYRLFGLTSAFNPETVSRFDLATAAFSARYGDRLSSLLVVENRPGDAKQRFRGTAALSITDANFVGEGALPGAKGSWLLTARRTYYDFIANSLVDTDLPAFADLQGKLVFDAGADRRLVLQGLRSRESADAFFEGDRPDDHGTFVNAVSNDVVSLAFEAGLGARGRSRSVVSFYENTDTLDVDAQFQSEARRSNARDEDIALGQARVVFTRDLTVRDLALRHEMTLPAGRRQVLTAGLEAHGLETRSGWNITGDRNPFAANGSSVQGGAGLPDLLESSVSASRLGAFAEDAIELGALRLTPGLRVDWSGVNERASVSPRLSAAWRLLPRTTLRAGAGLFVQSPGYEKLIQADYFLDLSGDAPLDLEMARARHLLLGFQHDFGNGLVGRVEGFWKSFDDLIVGRLETEEERRARVARYDFPAELQDSVPRARQITSFPVNGSKGRAYGFDVYVSRPPAAGRRVSGWASYAFGRSERDAYGRRYSFEYDRPHAVSAVVAWRASRRFELAATLRAASGFPYTPVVGARVFAEEDPASGRLVPGRDPTGLLVYEIDLGDTSNLNSARLPTFARLDLRATFWPRGPTGRWQVYVDVINATSRDNAGAIEAELRHDPAADRPRIVFSRAAALPLLPSIGVRFRF